MRQARVRFGVDIGGTFTDVALDLGDRIVTAKVLTTPGAPEDGVIAGVRLALAQASLPPSAVGLFIHGTTLATNALIERKGARTALVTTEGHRDALELGFEDRFAEYDVYTEKTPPLVPRDLRFTVAERSSAYGDTLLPLDTDAVAALVPVLRHRGVASVAICFIHGYANPDHERRAAEILRQALPEVSISLSSDVCPEIREYERVSTTVCNAYVQPLVAGYLQRLQALLIEEGMDCPLLLMLSGGGLATLDTATRLPIRLVESGPAGGAIIAGQVAVECGYPQVLAFDMGGTTAKICLIEDGRPQITRNFEVDRVYRFQKGSGLPVRVPVIEMIEIGAGGGSIASVDSLKRLRVGPKSAGADPGPACYGGGGVHPTVTDADLVLGRIDPARFAGGRLTLDRSAAMLALSNDIGGPLQFDATLAAFGVSEMVDEVMANAARVHATERGKALGERTLIAFGGAGPLHAAALAERLGMHRVIVPAAAGVASAVGFLRAPFAYDVVRSRHMRLDAFKAEMVNALFAEMRAEAEQVVALGAPGERLQYTPALEIRYIGQGHEVTLKLPDTAIAAEHAEWLRDAFAKRYAEQYGRSVTGVELEILTFSLRVETVQPTPAMLPAPAAREAPLPSGTRPIVDTRTGRLQEAAIYHRDDLLPGVLLNGPAVIIEDQTTTIVPQTFDARIHPAGHIVLERRSTEASGERRRTALAAVDMQVMWNRLVSVVEEQAQALIRTAFSTAVREAGDLSAGVFDPAGRMIAQAVTGTPGHVNSMALSVGHFLRRHPLVTMQPGDVYLTNDPWLGTGHLFDFTVVTPVFRDGAAVALFACTAHVVDVGGIGFSADGRQVYEEGICIPIMPFARAGAVDEGLLGILTANVREPVQVRGDLYSLAACNEIGRTRLLTMMDEFGLADLDALSAFIVSNAETAMRAEIAKWRPGTYRHSMRIDGYERPVELQACVTIGANSIHVDYAGTSECSDFGINVPLAYTTAYTAFGIRCLVGPEILNNAGSLATMTVAAPEGCILNAPRPHAVSARQAVGQMLPELIFGCLHQAMPIAPAEGAGSLWSVPLFGGAGAAPGATGRPFTSMSILAGGTGARPSIDGLSATAFPSRVRGIPIEIIETLAPVVFWKKELRTDSGGPGQFRGGLGQTLEIGSANGQPFAMSAGTCDRTQFAALGRQGGSAGACGRIGLASGAVFADKRRHVIPPGERLRLELPGGGGYGDIAQRDPAAVRRDVRLGFVSASSAMHDYGCDLTDVSEE